MYAHCTDIKGGFLGREEGKDLNEGESSREATRQISNGGWSAGRLPATEKTGDRDFTSSNPLNVADSDIKIIQTVFKDSL
jgi:hypothetical protein